MLNSGTLRDLENIYMDRTLLLVGCRALGLGDSSCYYDIAVYPGTGLKKTMLDEKKTIIIPINSQKEFLKSNTVFIYGVNFDYQYIVEDNQVKYYRKKALKMLKNAMNRYLLSKNGGNSFLKASIMNTAEALLLTEKIEPASSHIFKQVSELSTPEASLIIEAAMLDENLGSLLKARSDLLSKELDPVDSVVFSEKINMFTSNNRQIEASAYFYHKLSQLPDNRLTMLNRDMKFGLPSEKDERLVLSLIKKVSGRVSKLV